MNLEAETMEGVLNLSAALDNMDGDVELLVEIVEIFMETGKQQLETLAASIAQQDAKAVAIQAHAMKGGASNFCAANFVATALELELLAKEGGLDGASELLARLQDDFTELDEVIRVVNWDEVARVWAI